MTPTSTLAIVGYCVLALVVAYVSLRLIRLLRARNASSLPIPVSASSSQSISGWVRSTAWGWAKWSKPWTRTTKPTPTPSKSKGKTTAKNLTVELLPVTALPPHPSSLPPTPPLVDLSYATSPSRPASAAIKHHNIPHPSYPRPPSPHALLATTTPSKHRRSRSLGGVPVEVEMRDMGLRERDALASTSSREHLLIDFSSSSSEEWLGQEPRRISPAAVLPAVPARGGSVVNARTLPLVDLGDEESGNESWNWHGAKRSLENRMSPFPSPLAEAKLVDLQSPSEDEDEDDGLVLPLFNGKSAAMALTSQQRSISVHNVAHLTFSSTHLPLRLSKSESSSPQLVDITPDDPFVDPPSSQVYASVLSTPSTVVPQEKDFVGHPLEEFMEPEIVIQHEDVKADASLLMQVDQDDTHVGHPEDLEAGAQDPFVDVESSTQEEASDEEIFHYPSPTVENPPSVPVSPQSDDDEEFHYPGAEEVPETAESVHNQEPRVSVSQSTESPTSPCEFVYPSEGTSAWSFDNEDMDNDADEDPWASAISAQSVVEYAEESARGEGSDLISFGFDERLEEKSPGGSLLPLQGEDEDEVPVLILERSMLDVEESGDEEEEEEDTTPRPTPSSASIDLPEVDSVSEEDAVPVAVFSPEPEAGREESANEEFPDPELLPLPKLLLSTATIPKAVDVSEPTVPAISILPCDQEAPASISVKAAAQTPTPPASPPAALSALRVLNPRPHISNSANSSPRLGIKHSFSGGRSLPPSPRIQVRNVDLPGTANAIGIPSPISITYSKSLPLMESSPKADGEEKENVSPALQRPLWSLRAADAPALGLKAEGGGTSPFVRKRAVEREREDTAPEQGVGVEKKEPQEPETTLPVEQLPETEVEVEHPTEIKVSLSLPGSFPDPTAPAAQDVPSVATVTTDAASATATANLALAALTLLSAASASSSSSTSTSATTAGSGEDSSPTTVAQPRQQPRARLPTPRSPLDIALAMQLRPGLGAGADPAWMVRFLMAMYGWFGLLISGQGDF